jgi:hypothetical protein
MRADQIILEHWLARLLEDYPGRTVGLPTQDKFRNPVGYTLRESLATLVQQLLGAMDLPTVRIALESIVRIRTVQGLNANQAVGFVFSLKPILEESLPQAQAVSLNSRIDQLALMASQEYARCCEQLAKIRASERQRAMSGAAALARARHNP